MKKKSDLVIIILTSLCLVLFTGLYFFHLQALEVLLSLALLVTGLIVFVSKENTIEYAFALVFGVSGLYLILGQEISIKLF